MSKDTETEADSSLAKRFDQVASFIGRAVLPQVQHVGSKLLEMVESWGNWASANASRVFTEIAVRSAESVLSRTLKADEVFSLYIFSSIPGIV